MKTDYRGLFLLACCQALLLTNAAGLIAMNGLVGYSLAGTKSLATLGVTTYVIGSALATLPMSLWMAQVGRRRGFMAGALVNIAGCGIAASALVTGSFALYCLATAIIGIYNAVGLQYRFAATEIAAQADKAVATSLVLAGGIAGGFVGPAMTRAGQHWFATPFLGSFLLLAGVAVVALALQALVSVPPPSAIERAGGGRNFRDIARQPVFIIAVLSAAMGYGLMNLLMTATPLAMNFCALPYTQAVIVIQWHVVGMFAPGLITGSLIKRFGVLTIVSTGIAIMGLGSVVALNGLAISHFVAALMLVGIGWNFMYTGGTLLLAEAHSTAERARVQGANDFIVFAVMGVSSLSAGALVSSAGWEVMNLAALPVLGFIAGLVGWYARRRSAVTGIETPP